MEIEVYDQPTTYEWESAVNIPNSRWFNDDVKHQLFYSPSNPVLDGIVGNVSQKLGFTLPVMAFDNSLELLNSAQTMEPFASIEFEDSLQVICFVINELGAAFSAVVP